MFNIKEELKKLPENPGVYLMKDNKETIIYVGKAKVLKNRVKSYFVGIDKHNNKTKELVSNIASFEYIITATEVEALVLECNLIKKHMPKYNIIFKDGKGYPYIKVVTNEMYPRVVYTRNYRKDGNKYFGPYVDSLAVNEVLDLLNKLFPTRRCSKVFPRDLNKERPCLNYQIKQCSAPCNMYISEDDYKDYIDSILKFLGGDTKEIEYELNQKMLQSSEELDFETAKDCRDKLIAINKLKEKQTMENDNNENIDIIGLSRNDDIALIEMFYYRSGKVLGREQFVIEDGLTGSRIEVITEFLKQHYNDTTFIPNQILVEKDIEDSSVLEYLELIKGSKVDLRVPKKGSKLSLLRMANENATMSVIKFGENLAKEQKRTLGALEELRVALGVDSSLKRIESYDISNTSGVDSVGALIAFVDGKPKREDYRKFKIKTVIGSDDYSSMKEVITRRLERYISEKDIPEEKRKFSNLPDAFFIDGGKGHISIVERVLDELGFNSIIVVGLVKDDKHRTRGMVFKGEQILIPRTSEGFKLITRIQDEVHRFALSYHKTLRKKGMHSILDKINGVGERRRNNLLNHFGNINDIENASLEQLMEVDGITQPVAENILSFFHKS